MVALKHRHSLSGVCVNEICSLLCILNVPNAPSSWFQVKICFDELNISGLDRKQHWVCPKCKMASADKLTCTNNNCSWCFSPPSPMPNHFYSFNLIEQLTVILATTHDLVLPGQKRSTINLMSPMTDITSGNHYKKILHEESSGFLTLTMSTDGIQPYNCTEKSIWSVTFVINEIKRKKRYSFQNLILGGVWPGPTKPKRFEMHAFLEPLVIQLKELERGLNFEYRSNAGYVTRLLKVFLICACMDKPAQALVQNLPEPTGLFGCGRCELRGKYLFLIKIFFFLILNISFRIQCTIFA